MMLSLKLSKVLMEVSLWIKVFEKIRRHLHLPNFDGVIVQQ